MSRRVTRSSAARLNADPPNPTPVTLSQASPSTATDAGSPPVRAPPHPSSTSNTRKRKAPPDPDPPQASRDQRKSKRSKVGGTGDPEAKALPTPDRKRGKKSSPPVVDMSSAGTSSGSLGDASPPQTVRESSKRKSNRKKPKEEVTGSTSASGSRKSKRGSKKDRDVVVNDVDEKAAEAEEEVPAAAEVAKKDAQGGGADDRSQPPRRFREEDLDDMARQDDPFAGGYLGRFGGHSGLSSSLRALSGMLSGTTARLRNILEQLRTKEDPSVQLIALQDLSELLLVSNEDNLSGHFAPDQFVKELIVLMQPNDFTGEENPEIMLLACRCIANMMEALPASTASVVYGGAVPILCQKLLEIHFIDLAEQALSTLEKISVEFPSSIVREGGLTACLTYLDFFATSTQRTAVTTAANCCRNIPEDSFPTVRDVMPILLNTLSSSDQRVVEQASLCVSRIVDSFKNKEEKLEELVSPDLLKAILRLLLPGSTNMVGPHIHTQFLRVLSFTARASPRLSVELLKMNVVDTLYQILTGTSAPADTEDAAASIDKNVIMQAIIRTPREQIFETLNVICELLPNVQREDLMFLDDLQDAGNPGPGTISMSTRSKKTPNDTKLELLAECQPEVKRFAVILFPTLMYAFTSTVNLSVRHKVLTAQLKMLSNFATEFLAEALRNVSYASHLASILTQQENASLVTFALQAAELLLKRMEPIYRPQFYREGVMAEILKLADRPLHADAEGPSDKAIIEPREPTPIEEPQSGHVPQDEEGEVIDVEIAHNHDEDDGDGDREDDEDGDGDGEDDEDDDGGDHEHDEDDEDDNVRSDGSEPPPRKESKRSIDTQDVVTIRAGKFTTAHVKDDQTDLHHKAETVMNDLKSLASELRVSYAGSKTSAQGSQLFTRLARYFDGDALESVTSYELMTSGVVEVLLNILNNADEHAAAEARADFLEVFMSTTTSSSGKSSSPFSVLVMKLQDLLSRAEHFEVITVHHNAWESNKSSAASMLAKQLRLKLVADDGSGIPRSFRNIMVSIHAIATFKALDDYLRPRITMSERPRGARSRDGIASAMAAYAAAMAGQDDPSGMPPMPPMLPSLGSSLPARTAPPAVSTGGSTKKDVAVPEADGKEQDDAPRLRRSSRRQSTHTPIKDDTGSDLAPATSKTSDEQEEANEPLECADEAQISDDENDEDGMDEDDDLEADLEALVDDLEEGALDQEGPDPSAVNLEVAKSGKVTARTEDGARINTPTQGAPTPTSRDRFAAASRLALAREMLSTPTSSARQQMSYASALQQPSQDWHIEFSVKDQPITSETTIYRACHFNQTQGEDVSSRHIWAATHTIQFKRVPGPALKERQSSPASLDPKDGTHESNLPQSLDKHPVTANILRLMSILHELNANFDDVLVERRTTSQLDPAPLAHFVNTKLTAKLNRQLEEPLIVASQCLPSWSEDLARLYPFLFPFETRHLFLQSTSFGYARSMSRWQSSQSENDRRHRDERPFLGRIQRQKVRISRSRILESAIKVMELYGGSQSLLEVEYFEEVGTGLGPTLEFYSTVSKEFSKKKTKLWRENESTGSDDYAFGKRGLFPAPMDAKMAENDNGQRLLHLFKMLGKFVARSMMDSRIIDMSFNPTFFRVGDGSASVTPSLGAVATVDQDLAKSLKTLKKYVSARQRILDDDRLSAAQKQGKLREVRINDMRVEDLGLDFTLPGYPHIELQPGGSSIDVDLDNVGQYIKSVIDMTLASGVQRQVDAFRVGFSQVFPYSALRAFTPDELVMLFGRSEEDWSLETLMDSIKADHGYNLDSKSVRNLLQVMSELSPQSKRDFLQFVTGSPKLPIGGFKALTPMFTVVCKPSEPPLTSDDYLPSVMTCVNYLKMPDYSSLEVLGNKLGVAIREGQGAFHLS